MGALAAAGALGILAGVGGVSSGVFVVGGGGDPVGWVDALDELQSGDEGERDGDGIEG